MTGRIFVISGPSGVGKGTICKRLLAEDAGLALSTSATSRPMRDNETDGVDYYFKTRDDFRMMIDAGELLEWAEYNGNYYGTPAFAVARALEHGQNVLLEIDVQGALQVKKRFPSALLIFVAPPSMDELASRLHGRGTDDQSTIANRLAISEQEMTLQDCFDAVVVNDDLDVCLGKIRSRIKTAVV